MTDVRIAVADLPAKDASVEGIVWLPRLIPKAKAKLRGEMPDELMYGCSGDRKFFKDNGVDPAKLLRMVWESKGNDQAVIDFVRQGCRSATANQSAGHVHDEGSGKK